MTLLYKIEVFVFTQEKFHLVLIFILLATALNITEFSLCYPWVCLF